MSYSFSLAAANSAQTGHPRKLQHAGYPVREPSIERERRGPSPASTRPPVSVASNVQMDVVQQAYSIPSHEANPPGQVGKVNVMNTLHFLPLARPWYLFVDL